MDSAALLGRIAGADKAAFTQLYRALQAKMERYAAGLLAGDMHLAADAVDEAFMDIWRNASSWSGSGSADGWIRRIVRNKAIDAIRKIKEKPGLNDAEQAAYDNQADDADTPEEALEKKSDGDELRRAMDRLSPEHREAIWLCYYEGLSLAQIAEQADVPENTVKTRLFHARKQLKKLLAHGPPGLAEGDGQEPLQ
ncbi:MAG: RNA polymerase sigma factor [Sphingomonadaceae bacterium]